MKLIRGYYRTQEGFCWSFIPTLQGKNTGKFECKIEVEEKPIEKYLKKDSSKNGVKNVKTKESYPVTPGS